MQIIDFILGSVIFEFIGASAKWVYSNVKDRLRGERPKTFSEIWNGRKKASFQESIEHGWSNIFLGVAIIIILIIVLTWIDV